MSLFAIHCSYLHFPLPTCSWALFKFRAWNLLSVIYTEKNHTWLVSHNYSSWFVVFFFKMIKNQLTSPADAKSNYEFNDAQNTYNHTACFSLVCMHPHLMAKEGKSPFNAARGAKKLISLCFTYNLSNKNELFYITEYSQITVFSCPYF